MYNNSNRSSSCSGNNNSNSSNNKWIKDGIKDMNSLYRSVMMVLLSIARGRGRGTTGLVVIYNGGGGGQTLSRCKKSSYGLDSLIK